MSAGRAARAASARALTAKTSFPAPHCGTDSAVLPQGQNVKLCPARSPGSLRTRSQTSGWSIWLAERLAVLAMVLNGPTAFLMLSSACDENRAQSATRSASRPSGSPFVSSSRVERVSAGSNPPESDARQELDDGRASAPCCLCRGTTPQRRRQRASTLSMTVAVFPAGPTASRWNDPSRRGVQTELSRSRLASSCSAVGKWASSARL